MSDPPAAIHVVPAVDGWAVTREGRDVALSHHRSEEEAVEAGREAARREGAPLVVHDASAEVRPDASEDGRTGGDHRAQET
jgi:xanthine dehydrogenase iron-sulfur cluster and FAD-binding subunit A